MGINFNAWLNAPWILINNEFENHNAVMRFRTRTGLFKLPSWYLPVANLLKLYLHNRCNSIVLKRFFQTKVITALANSTGASWGTLCPVPLIVLRS